MKYLRIPNNDLQGSVGFECRSGSGKMIPYGSGSATMSETWQHKMYGCPRTPGKRFKRWRHLLYNISTRGLTLSFSLILCTNIRGGAGSELGLVGTEDPQDLCRLRWRCHPLREEIKETVTVSKNRTKGPQKDREIPSKLGDRKCR
jgi:hypothetical protein